MLFSEEREMCPAELLSARPRSHIDIDKSHSCLTQFVSRWQLGHRRRRPLTSRLLDCSGYAPKPTHTAPSVHDLDESVTDFIRIVGLITRQTDRGEFPRTKRLKPLGLRGGRTLCKAYDDRLLLSAWTQERERSPADTCLLWRQLGVGTGIDDLVALSVCLLASVSAQNHRPTVNHYSSLWLSTWRFKIWTVHSNAYSIFNTKIIQLYLRFLLVIMSLLPPEDG